MTPAELDEIRHIHKPVRFKGWIVCQECCIDYDRNLTPQCDDRHQHSSDPHHICDVARLLAHFEGLNS